MSLSNWKPVGLWAGMAAGLSVGMSVDLVRAQDGSVGMARISDRAGAAIQQTGGSKLGGYDASAGYVHGSGSGDCPECYGYHGKQKHGWFNEHYCKMPADYGYSVPGKYPILRQGVQYNAYFPAQWYGAGGVINPATGGQAFPMAYTPTDTSQLGFYYQHVPFWQPNPNMLPARPIPAQWHNLAPAVAPSSFCPGGPCFGNGMHGGVVVGSVVNGSTTSPTPLPAGSNGAPVNGGPAFPNAAPPRPIETPPAPAAAPVPAAVQPAPVPVPAETRVPAVPPAAPAAPAPLPEGVPGPPGP